MNVLERISEEPRTLLDLVLLLAYSALSLYLLIKQSRRLIYTARLSWPLKRYSLPQTTSLLVDAATLSAATGMSLIVAVLWYRYLNDLPMLENIYPSLIRG